MSTNNEKGVIESFVKELEECLRNGDTTNAMLLFKNKINEDIIEYSSWDIIPMISTYLEDPTIKDKKALFQCCEAVLSIIAETFNPSETALLCVEQISPSEDDLVFYALLKPIGISLRRLTNKSKAIEFCIIVIQEYLRDLPIPESDNSDSNEDKATNEKNLNRIINLYESVILFVQSVIQDFDITSNSQQDRVFRDYVLGLLIYLLGSPYCYLCKDNLYEKILQCIFRLTTDVLYFLNFVNNRSILENYKACKKNVNRKRSKDKVFENEEIVPTLGYANLYFYIMTTDDLWIKLPQIYHPNFIFQQCIYLVNSLLQKNNNVLIDKALLFMEHLIKRVDKLSIDSNNLELIIYANLLNNIINVMTNCDIESKRKEALSIFRECINVFDMEARYFLIIYLYNTSSHSGVLSLTTSLLKTFIIESLETTPPCVYFSGKNLEVLLKRVCHLSHGSETDIVEISDEIITTLNLLRFLFIRDKSNHTGIWNLLNMLEENYLKPLTQAIHLSRKYWKTILTDLESIMKTDEYRRDTHSKTKMDKKVTLSIGNMTIPPLPITQKIKLSHQILCCVDVMESLITRVNECIQTVPQKIYC